MNEVHMNDDPLNVLTSSHEGVVTEMYSHQLNKQFDVSYYD